MPTRAGRTALKLVLSFGMTTPEALFFHCDIVERVGYMGKQGKQE